MMKNDDKNHVLLLFMLLLLHYFEKLKSSNLLNVAKRFDVKIISCVTKMKRFMSYG